MSAKKERKLVSFDWAMKKLLRSKANFEVLEGFLSELLKDDVTIIEILESESNKEDLLDKYNRVDLKVKNNQDEFILIEVQYNREFDYLQRILYQTAKTITEHMKEAAPYSKVVKVISISILYFELGYGKDYVYQGSTSFYGLHNNDELQLSISQKKLYGNNRKISEIYPEYYLIRVNKFNDIAKNTLDEWIYFLKNEEIKDSFSAKGLKKAKEVLDIIALPEKERRAYEKYVDDLHYQASMVESSYSIGMLKGREKEKIKMAKALLDILDIKTISEKTGLSVEEIENLT